MRRYKDRSTGLILCARKDDPVARYALEGLPNKGMASEYRTALPGEKELAAEIGRTQVLLERTRTPVRAERYPRILLQSMTIPSWTGIGVKGWLAKADPALDLKDRLKLDSLKVGQRFRFRLRANPCVTRNGKRLGLLRLEEQEKWIERKAKLHGFSLPQLASFDLSESSQERVDIRISQEQMLRGNQHSGNAIRIFSVLYDGILTVTEPDRFRNALQTGIGHGKAMGLGLMSVAPINQVG